MFESVFARGGGETLRTEDIAIPSGGGGSGPGGEGQVASLDAMLADLERQVILAALRRAGGGRSRAARQLRISRSRLYRRMSSLGIEPNTVKA